VKNWFFKVLLFHIRLVPLRIGGGPPTERQEKLFLEMARSSYDDVLREYATFFEPSQFLVLPNAAGACTS
jgi:hypothetical protein